MANTNNPFGFRSFGHRDGSAPTMGLERVFILSSDANPVFTGDVVTRSSATPGYVTQYFGSSLAPVPAGVFAGCEFYNPTVSRVTWSSYFPGSVSSSSPVIAYIISDPEMQFTVQASSLLGSSAIGTNYNILSGASSLGSILSGVSNVSLATGSTVTGVSSYPFRLVDMYSNFAPPGVNGTDNTTAFSIGVVVPNGWDRKVLTGITS
jgi:hypothetical protein